MPKNDEIKKLKHHLFEVADLLESMTTSQKYTIGGGQSDMFSNQVRKQSEQVVRTIREDCKG